MNREEFSVLLVNTRLKANLSKNELCFQAQWRNFNQLQIIENATSNYNLNRVFIYLKVTNSCIFITNGKNTQIICSEDKFIEWMASEINKIGKSKFSQMSQISRSALNNIETGKTTARIDTFLKIIETLGYNIDKIC